MANSREVDAMYFPYLRGKQYELLALKEYAGILGSSGNVVPLIEPVRDPDGGLDRCFEALWADEVEFALILNPSVGKLARQGLSPALSAYVETASDRSWNLALLIDEGTDVRRLIGEYQQQVGTRADLTLIHRGICDEPEYLRIESKNLGRKYDIVNDTLRRRHFGKFLNESSGVILHDGFRPESRNAGYLTREESVFTEDNLYFQEEGWAGFADYLTIGEGWTEGGFTPRAVAIHWTYQPSPESPIMIRHFTSESNGDIADVGGKFLEACGKLVRFLDDHGLEGRAAAVMRSHFAAQTYPGLGIVKKLSIQNHLELMATVATGPQ